MKKIFSSILILAILFLLTGCTKKSLPLQKKVTLTYWGLWETENVIKPIIDEYQGQNPNITIKYMQQTPSQYRERLETALNKGEVDIFRFHNTWTPMLSNYLSPIPVEIYDNQKFEKTFYPVAQKDLRSEGQYIGIPLELDSIALYYNEDLLKSAGVTPPTTWKELEDSSQKLRSPKGVGKIDIAGVALGNASNVDHWQDIMSLMLLQGGADPAKPSGQQGENALTYYTYFTKLYSVWDDTLDNSTLAFAKGKLAFYFAPSWRYFDIKSINPSLNFSVVPAPQLADTKVNMATYWVEGVNKISKNKKEAWDFLNFLSQKSTLAKLYELESKTRIFGEPPSRVDMREDYSKDPIVSIFLSQAESAESFYLASFTQDGETGINSKVNKYYENAINDLLKGKSAQEAALTLSQGLAQVLSTYNISAQ